METRVLPIESPASFRAAVEAAAALLRAGQIVAVPTETVYGLASNALSENAVAKIFQAKGRPAANPVIVHVASLAMARECVAEWPARAAALARKFWPGPLTLVLPKAQIIPEIVTAGGQTVGIRWPAHPFMRELIQRCGFPLAAPSANPANQLSPTLAAHVFSSMKDRVPLIVDAGPSNVGIESTVLDLSSGEPRLLRPGMVQREAIEEVLGTRVLESQSEEGVRKSPGMMLKHYSPRAPLLVTQWEDEQELLGLLREKRAALPGVHVLAHERIPRSPDLGRVCVIPQDPDAYARAFYNELHRCDAENAALIVVEELPHGSLWTGLRDRLNRASAGACQE